MRKKHWVLAGAAAMLLLAACSRPGSTQGANQRSATLAKQALSATVSATGNIQPESDVRLSFQSGGTVAEVLRKQGDRVKKNDVIARLDTTDLKIALAQAEASVAQAQTGVKNAEQAMIVAAAGYSRTVEGARAEDITAAQASYSAALANYDKVRKGPLPQDYAAAEAAMKNAEAALKQAQFAYDAAFKFNPAGIGGHPAAIQLEQATNNFTSAKAQFDKASQGADRAQLATAWQSVQSAKSQLDKLKAPTRAFDIDQAAAQREQAKLQAENAQTSLRLAEFQVQQAKRRIDLATLVAPNDGVLSQVSAKVGEVVGAQPVATLVDDSKLHIDITVDEIDVAKVKDGQDVGITLDALTGVELKGKVERISPTSTTINGVVSYVVRVIVDKSDAALRTGMTANASIVLDRRDNVLVAPNWAIRRDRQTGKSFITLKDGDKTSEIEVQTGLRNDAFTEIVNGATEGQIVVAPTAPGALP